MTKSRVRAVIMLVTLLLLALPMGAHAIRGGNGNGGNNGNDNGDASQFSVGDVDGRYVTAENAYDTSSVHAFAAPNGSLVGPPIFFATTAVMIADGKGNVCGEADGFYSGISAPGVNLGPSLFHGTYTVEATTGRVTINTCGDGAPGPVNAFCATSTACSPVTKVQVGYLQDKQGMKITTVEQTGSGTDADVTGFLVHHRVWTKRTPGRGLSPQE